MFFAVFKNVPPPSLVLSQKKVDGTLAIIA
jgi:hypothetical protein